MKLATISQHERSVWRSELSNSKFTIPEVLTTLENCHYVYDITIGNVRVVYAVEKKESPLRVRMKLLRSTKRLVKLSQHLQIKPLSFVIIPCTAKRYWPHPGNIVTSHNINGGFTYKLGDIVYIYREEEYPKVMLHEAIHHTHLDPSPSELEGVESLFRNTFNIATNMKLLPGEGIVEAFAVYYQCNFIATETNIPFDSIWTRELKYMKKQAETIINKSKERPWFETTNSFAYIVVKWICCSNIIELLQGNRSLLSFFQHALRKMSIEHQDADAHPTSMRLTIFGDL